MYRWIAALVVLTTASTGAWGAQWEVDTTRSHITFAATFEGAEFEGRFTVYTAHMDFNPIDLDASRFEVRVEMNSADTGSGELNDGMMLREWFDSHRFPIATFVTSGFKAQETNRYLAVGKLTIKGIAREVALPFTWNQQGGTATIDGTVALNRTEFHIGEGEWSSGNIVGLTVKVSTHLALKRRQP